MFKQDDDSASEDEEETADLSLEALLEKERDTIFKNENKTLQQESIDSKLEVTLNGADL